MTQQYWPEPSDVQAVDVFPDCMDSGATLVFNNIRDVYLSHEMALKLLAGLQEWKRLRDRDAN